uniref:Protein draper-like n=1 Tax=Crassostrea virginica TaxID=6565 RepID=A0A8B8AH07_CRAVI|nr:protein draper-like [Crassostrea virginica]
MPGYLGHNCTQICPYPLYGKDCQFTCHCQPQSCDHATGCRTPTTEMVNICPPGYFGSLCRAKCIYPSYGKECKEVCDCSEDVCNVTTGCQEKKEMCLPGYFGFLCKAKCVYPFYGEECQGHCDCNENLCDVTHGCKPVIEGNYQETGTDRTLDLHSVERHYKHYKLRSPLLFKGRHKDL